MIRVALVTEDLGVGGMERLIEGIARSLDPNRFGAEVLCLTRGGGIAENLAAAGVRVSVLGIRRYHSPWSIVRVARWYRGRDICVVHTHGYSAGVLGRVAACAAGVPRIFHHVHSTYVGMRRRHHLVESLLARRTDAVLCCSEAVRRFVLSRQRLTPARVRVLYNGVPGPESEDAAGRRRLRQELDLPAESVVVGSVGSLTPHKGHEVLLEAFRSIPSGHLLIVGDGPLRGHLEARAAALGIRDRVRFAGCRSPATPFLRLMDVVVLPSTEREGFGLALVEAMSVEKPVVASALGGIPEVVEDGRTGRLVPPGDACALAAAIRDLLDSPETRRLMGSRGLARYRECFTLDSMVRHLEALYEGRAEACQ